MRFGPAVVAALAAATAPCASASAHEFWIQPDSFTPPAGQPLAVRLFVGSPGSLQEVPRRQNHLVRFEILRLSDRMGGPVPGVFGSAPAGQLPSVAPGRHVVVYQGGPSLIEMPAGRFEGYLVEEGLARIVAERVRRDETLRPGRESYGRYAKALLRAGRPGNGAVDVDVEVGLPIEFVPSSNPFSWRAGDSFEVRLVLDGQPLADQQVKLIHLVDRELQILFRTDAAGAVSLRPPRAGPWMLASVFMRRAASAESHDWESLWASLTFELPEETPSGESARAPSPLNVPR